MNKLLRMRLSVLIGVMATTGVGAGLALAQTPPERAAVQATAHRVDCSKMPEAAADEARRLRGCYDVEIVSAPADVTDLEIAAAEAAAVCAAIEDPAARPEACSLFDAEEAVEG